MGTYACGRDHTLHIHHDIFAWTNPTRHGNGKLDVNIPCQLILAEYRRAGKLTAGIAISSCSRLELLVGDIMSRAEHDMLRSGCCNDVECIADTVGLAQGYGSRYVICLLRFTGQPR